MGNRASSLPSENSSDKIQNICDAQRIENLLNIGKVMSNYRWSKDKFGCKECSVDENPSFKTDNVELLIISELKENDSPKNRKDSLKWRIREYFIDKFDHESEKYVEDDDAMSENDDTSLEDDNATNVTDSDNFKLRVIDFTAGSVGGVLQTLVAQPFDTIKVKLQMFPQMYKDMLTCFRHTVKTDGYIRGLYAGTVPAVVASVAENSVLFAAYGGCQTFIANIFEINEISNLSVLGNACAGVLAAFFTAFSLCPTELVKCKLQAISETKEPPVTAMQITKDIIKKEGIPGLFRGLTSTMVREMPGLFFFFGGYEATRTLLAEEGQSRDEISDWKTMIAGAVGGLALWICIFPIDVIKTRIQVNNIKQSMLSVGMEIVRKEGITALYNGLLPTVIRTTPACATLFYSYEQFKKILTKASGI